MSFFRTSAYPYQPVIIIGAARSGTNMLRDVMVRLPGCGTWPCDEINYIWRHGNRDVPTDEFQPLMATPKVRGFIRRAFERQARQQALATLVEKTCANALRVAFVARVFPEARFVYIHRDGRDVVASAIRRWTAPLDLPYILRKARYVPLGDVPYYASRYLWNRVYRLRSRHKRLAFWGPRFEGMEEALRSYPLAGVCALQWQRSVWKAESDLARLGPARVHAVAYEQFVTSPVSEMKRLACFLDREISAAEAATLTAGVSARSLDKWRKHLADEEIELVETLLEDTLNRNVDDAFALYSTADVNAPAAVR